MKLLLVEDDLEFAHLMQTFLKQRSIEIDICDDPFKVLVYDIKAYDMILLDLGLPGMDGLEVCKEIRAKSDIAIIISSARGGVNDKILGLQLGADDYLPKPYDPDELYARIITVLRRYKKADTSKEKEKNESIFHIDESLMDICYKSNHLNLTQSEFFIFSELLKSSGNIVSKEQLMNKISSTAVGNSLESMISKIRHKLKKHSDKNHIIASRGLGYRLVE